MDKKIYHLHALVCQTLANPKRLDILNTLGNSEMAAGELAAAIGITKANLSQHLAVMRERGIVLARREGLNVYYRVANPKVIQACELMRQVLFEQLAESGELAAQLQRRE
ncbi:MAG: metalloregulator ArsR/SmtB family transcription factor [Chloroflexota bacterium]